MSINTLFKLVITVYSLFNILITISWMLHFFATEFEFVKKNMCGFCKKGSLINEKINTQIFHFSRFITICSTLLTAVEFYTLLCRLLEVSFNLSNGSNVDWAKKNYLQIKRETDFKKKVWDWESRMWVASFSSLPAAVVRGRAEPTWLIKTSWRLVSSKTHKTT